MNKQLEQSLLIIGMGQYGFVAKEIAVAMNCFARIDFLDDNHPDALGKVSEMERFADQYTYAAVAIGNPQLRKSCLEAAGKHFSLIPLVHPRSYVSPSAIIAEGCVIEPMAVVHSQAQLGRGCLISAGAVINHNSLVGICCHIDCNATVAARAKVPAYTKVAAGQVYTDS